jgi:tetratricopeptide (TPR) repeat protein
VKFRLPILPTLFGLALLCANARCGLAGAADSLFEKGVQAYHRSDFAEAEQRFGESASNQPASGTLVNLGIAEWRRGRAGRAILAWERALWIDPGNDAACNNLDFARNIMQLDQPNLRWYEIASTWLRPNVWAWFAWGSMWLAVTTMLLPRVMRWRRAGWQQALATLGLGAFLLSVPAHVGILTRSRIGIVVDENTSLRLTPTEKAETISALAAGDFARQVRKRGTFVFVRTSRGSGWIQREQIGPICPDEK